ncbi:hypothetical protein [Allosphingosinicella sp.]|jgi:hypothetical protein|uniref:hypothetical protein n=1 Tax=Allosphingosinicella sp. TaxID=2823234 RepID=UPI002F229385
MANRLLRFEVSLFRRSFAIAFGRIRDILLLAVMVMIAVAWLQAQLAAGTWSLPPEGVWLGAVAGPAAFAWQRLVRARLDWLAQSSPLAADALDRRSRRTYIIASQFGAAVPLGIGAILVAAATGRPAATLLLSALAFGIGVGLAWIPRPGAKRTHQPVSRAPAPPCPQHPSPPRRAAFRALLRSQTLGSARPERAAALMLAATFALVTGAAWIGADQPDALRFALVAAPSLLAALAAGRLDAELVGFFPYAGYRASFLALAVAALPAAIFAAAAAALVTVRPMDWPIMVAVLFLLHLALILFAVARVWLYPGRNRRSAELQAELEFAGLAGVALMLPPLALVALGWRMWTLRRRYRSLMWLQL